MECSNDVVGSIVAVISSSSESLDNSGHVLWLDSLPSVIELSCVTLIVPVSVGLWVHHNDVVRNSPWAEVQILDLASSGSSTSVEIEVDMAGGFSLNAGSGVQHISIVS